MVTRASASRGPGAVAQLEQPDRAHDALRPVAARRQRGPRSRAILVENLALGGV